MICKTCGKEFASKRSTAVYCSGRCRLAFHRVGVSVSSPTIISVTKSLSVSDETVTETVKCDNCIKLELEVKKLLAKIALLETDNHQLKTVERIPNPRYDKYASGVPALLPTTEGWKPNTLIPKLKDNQGWRRGSNTLVQLNGK